MAWNKTKTKEWNKEEKEMTDPRMDITKRVLESMKEARDGGLQYQRGWFVSNEFPYNPISGKQYSGANVLSLLADKYADPRFIPAGEVSKLFKESEGEIHIKKGEKASRIIFAKPNIKGTGEFDPETLDEIESKSFIYKYHPVFNITQLTGTEKLEELFPRKKQMIMNSFEENAFINEVEKAMALTGLRIEHMAAGNAFYSPSKDLINLPEAHRFASASDYSRTKLHEIGHATGHKSRCDRIQIGEFGSKEYAYEELVAELYSQFMGMETGIRYDSRTMDNHSAYLNNWIDVLESDTKEAKNYLISAASKAFKAKDYVMDRVKALRLDNKAVLDKDEKQAVKDYDNQTKIIVPKKKCIQLAI